ncbi:hypothetical protein QCN29_06375 [Streptomyces sp. HNM0663]|uniref:Uncharacterized protein n=1 Tax=Streptomyces chengmaiensis TaxID=3040919 RepID=A0ABT6HII4_9ACTN|nr:hypothetical protein [Streptomyces chengmaiensis]MDH2388416.1 hypothetical protein [Streptomyces chengmaiensis]
MLKWTLRAAAVLAVVAAIAAPVVAPAPEAAVATPAVSVVAPASGPDVPGDKLTSAVNGKARFDYLVA